MITRSLQLKQLETIEKNRIFLYHLNEAKKEIKKGNDIINVLYQLLVKEINLHNGNIKRKYNKVMNLPTID